MNPVLSNMELSAQKCITSSSGQNVLMPQKKTKTAASGHCLMCSSFTPRHETSGWPQLLSAGLPYFRSHLFRTGPGQRVPLQGVGGC